MILFLAGQALAYPFMIGHGYTGCAQCHVDPSGGSALTEYGRGQAEIFMRSVYGERAAEYEPGAVKDFAFGVPLPESLQLQGDVRGLFIPQPDNMRFILMQADMRGHLGVGAFRAYGSLGYASEGAYGARVTGNDSGGNLISREWWLGGQLGKRSLLRAGRMPLPFGIRSEEHLLYARSATRTDTNDDQQVGLDFNYGSKKLRAELMGIAGNFSVSPDEFRERGYSAFAAYALDNQLEVGMSSLVAHSQTDVEALDERLRQAHGLFGRWAPWEPVRFLVEANTLVDSVAGASATLGTVGYLQVDVEPVQGLHVKGTGEWCDNDHGDELGAVMRGSATALWFFAPHADLRLDALYGTLFCTPGSEPFPMGMAQVHVFL